MILSATAIGAFRPRLCATAVAMVRQLGVVVVVVEVVVVLVVVLVVVVWLVIQVFWSLCFRLMF